GGRPSRSARGRVRGGFRHGAAAPGPLGPRARRPAGDRLRPVRGRAGRRPGRRPGRRAAGGGSPMKRTPSLGMAGAIARAFIGSKLTPLLAIGSVLVGILAIVVLPREEEPQIKVPVVDILVGMPGATAAEVERR